MNQMNVKFNIKTSASSIKQIEEHLLCCAVVAVALKERTEYAGVRPYCIKGGVSSQLASSFYT